MKSKKIGSLNAKQHSWLRRTLTRHMKSTLVVPALGASLMLAAPMIANAADHHVTTEAELRTAISEAIDGDTIYIDNDDIVLTMDLPAITSSITIDGDGHNLDAANYRSFYVAASANPNVQNLTVNNGGDAGIFSNATTTFGGGPNTSISFNGSTTFNGSAVIGNSGDGNGNTEFNVRGTENTVTGGISVYDKSTVNVYDIWFGSNHVQTNELNSSVFINSGDASVNIGGILGNNNSAANESIVSNTLTGNVTGASEVGGSVDISTGILTSNNNATSNNTVTNTLTGFVILDGSDSHVSLGNAGIVDGFGILGPGNINSGSTNTINNQLTGNVTLTNGGTVDLGRNADDDTTIVVYNDATSNSTNFITNNITGVVTVTDGDVNFNGGSFDVIGSGDIKNTIANQITGKVILNGTGNLNFYGDSNTADDTGDSWNFVFNTITETAELNGASDSLVKGANNSIIGGLELNTTTNDWTVSGTDEHNDVTKLTIGGGDTADATSDILNLLHVDGDGVVVNPNPYSNNNYYNNYQRSADHGYDIDSGHVIVGAYGNSNTAEDGASITNTLEGSVTLNGTSGGADSWYNSGGMIIVGGASSHTGAGDGNFLSGGSSVTNEITGTVTLHGGSRLHLGGDEFNAGDDNPANSITNQIGGAVTADGNSFVAMWGENDSRLHNILGSTLTLDDNALFHAEGVNNTVTGGVTLNDYSIAQLGGSGGSHAPESNIAASYTLNDHSQLKLGNTGEFANSDIINHITGNVAVNENAALKVLSGGAGNAGGGANSAVGSSRITGDLTFGNNSTYLVNMGSNSITGLNLGTDNYTATLNNATVQVNILNNTLTFGRSYEILGTGYGTISGNFNPNVSLVDGNGDPADLPFIKLTPIKTTSGTAGRVDLRLLTQFDEEANTSNQQHFGQYLDNLVADSGVGGISDDPLVDNDLYDTLQNLAFQSNSNALNNFTGDTYAAFDLAGYWNASRFSNRVALHALQSRDSDWVQSFALNASQGLSGAGSQMSLVKQMLNSRPTLQLSANGNPVTGNTDTRSGIWGDITGDWLSNDGNGSIGSPDFNLNSRSVVLGYQGGSQKFTWGIAGGYHDGDLDFNNRAASGDVDGWNVGLNGLWKGNSGVYLNSVLAYSHDSNSLRREDGLGTNTSDFGGHAISAQLELGKKFEHGKNVHFTPYLSLLGMKYDRNSVSENGSGAGLDVGDASNSFFTSNLGVRLGRDFIDAKDGSKRGGLMLGVSWQHQFSDTDFPVTAALQNAAPGSSFQVQGTPLSKNGIGIQLGGYGRLSKNILGFLNYSGSFSSNQKLNSVTAGVEYQF